MCSTWDDESNVVKYERHMTMVMPAGYSLSEVYVRCLVNAIIADEQMRWRWRQATLKAAACAKEYRERMTTG